MVSVKEVLQDDDLGVRLSLAMFHRLLATCGGEFAVDASDLENHLNAGCAVKVEEKLDRAGIRCYHFQASV